MKTVIIGGVAGGASTATRLRRLDEKAEIVLIERGNYLSYANCGLPYYIGDVITERDNLFVQTEEGFKARFTIDTRTQSEVIKIDPEKKSISIKELSTRNVYEETYDTLVISTGAKPFVPPIPGIDDPRIFTLRNVPDTDKIKNYLNRHNPKRIVVVGAGFIGLEMAENLHSEDREVCIVEMADQVMAPIDFSMAAIVHQHLKSKKVGLFLEESVKSFTPTESGLIIGFQSGKKLEADMVIWSVGVRPESELAKEAGLSIGNSGGIKVNEYMQTSDKNIYAIGDVAEVFNPVLNKNVLIPLAGPANKQGRIVANNIVNGNSEKYPGSIGTSIAKVFDLTVATTGVSAKVLKKENIPYLSAYTHSASHASYYPGSTNLDIKIIFSPKSGKLLGAQIVGFDNVDNRINMFSQIIKDGKTVYDLQKIEHAYAPPFSSAKDPVNMAGYVGENILKEKVRMIHWKEFKDSDEKDIFILDVRTSDEYALGTIKNAVNIPLDELRNHMDKLPKDKKIVVLCAVGLRGYIAYRILAQNGFKNIYNLSGGIKTYQNAVIEQSTPHFTFSEKISCTPEKAENITGENLITIDACGLQCPGPILKLKKNYDELAVGQQLMIKSTDLSFEKDVQAWSNSAGAKLIYVENRAGTISAVVEKKKKEQTKENFKNKENKSIVVFSDDLDKALASFVIANGAAASGKKVTMFFTFWGLSIIKKKEAVVKKDLIGKLFSFMLPSGSHELALSKMEMFGIGSWMMRKIMKNKNIESLENLIQQAIDNDIEMIACTMSMDVMGIKKEELMDHVGMGGVATYIERAEQSDINLFI
ncbi:MAG: FAD-dependent oxidoreductase [Flavobacteriaceae bacterium]|jgi:NADPH-dependent 2,4-dienoyl-CoA reductase/sulfur reductase-like enzyme/peroxiredoxin family protein/rhodanese-related sulfurtransferase/TusA-related sulfurtransferase|nr:FAD-dependent oxidoreductase [Flavobacteriaceae bacterium]